MTDNFNDNPTLIEMRDAVVRRGKKDILTIDSFAMDAGESIAILGPNGSGKSTFINLITREIFPLHREEAAVLFQGKPNLSLEELKLKIGFVSSDMQQQVRKHLTALEVVEGGLFGSLGVPKRFKVNDDERAKALKTMRDIGVDDLAERDMLTLSSGQARRVLIARALVHDPILLVFDEPCTGLDPQGMYYVRATMQKIACSGKSVVLVTHYPEDIVPAIGRVLLIKDGKVFADGSSEALLTDPVLSDLFDIPMEFAMHNDAIFSRM